jgi:two-component system, OmpR family, response regulator MprA
MRIVVVDDDRGVRESLRRSLESNGYTVELAKDGRQAMDAVIRQRPDAMVLDMTMPKVDGLEVCRWLRSVGHDLPVLVLTARDAVYDRVAGLDAGADDYLSKPFLLEELLARLRALLRRSTFDRLRGPGAAPTVTNSDPSTHEADSASPPIEASAGDAESAAPTQPVKRHVRLKARLTTKIIGVASVIVAVIGLIPPFMGAFWAHDAPGATCFIIRNISDMNGIPQVVVDMNFRVEMRTRGLEPTYWLVLMLMLTDGSLRTEEKQIKETPGAVIFPLENLSTDAKSHNLMVYVDIVRVTETPVGSCL